MLPSTMRLPQTAFGLRPTRRVRFRYGSVSFFTHMPHGVAGHRVAVVVSKKIAKSAPLRNKIRRRVYHALRTLVPGLTRSVVIFPTYQAAKVPYTELESALADVLRAG